MSCSQLQRSKYFEQEIAYLAFRLLVWEMTQRCEFSWACFVPIALAHALAPPLCADALLHLHPHTRWVGHRWIGRWWLQSRSIRLPRLYRLFHFIIDFQNHPLRPVLPILLLIL